MARGYFRRLKSRVHSTHSSLTAYNGVIPSISSSSSAGEWGQEGAGLLSNFPNYWKRWGLTAHGWSAVEVIFSDFLDFLCICSCSFLLSFSLCFSIFSWALRAFSRDIFISFSFFLTSARSWDDVIPRAFSLFPSSCRSCSPLMLWALNSGTYWSRLRLINQWDTCCTLHSWTARFWLWVCLGDCPSSRISSEDSAKDWESPGVLGSAPKPLRSAELVLLGLKSSLKVKFCQNEYNRVKWTQSELEAGAPKSSNASC